MKATAVDIKIKVSLQNFINPMIKAATKVKVAISVTPTVPETASWTRFVSDVILVVTSSAAHIVKEAYILPKK